MYKTDRLLSREFDCIDNVGADKLGDMLTSLKLVILLLKLQEAVHKHSLLKFFCSKNENQKW